MLVSEFDYALPPERIARYPEKNPLDARLLFVSQKGIFQDSRILNLLQFLRKGDLLVYNDSQVIPARLHARRVSQKKDRLGGKIELLLVRQLDTTVWLVLARPARRLKPGAEIMISALPEACARAAILGREGEFVRLQFACERAQILQAGALPLPPYLGRKAEKQDLHRYQTVFARAPGSVAAPTAGLHFTKDFCQTLRRAGIMLAPVTLHIGPGTFLPLHCERIESHQMHGEHGILPRATALKIGETQRKGGRIIALGTTSLRIMESAQRNGMGVPEFDGETRLYIRPGFRFRFVDILLTNFHLPRSSLLVLVAGFIGIERTKKLYAHAIRNEYRFFSYGDACLLERPK